jgi:hypothetical protein
MAHSESKQKNEMEAPYTYTTNQARRPLTLRALPRWSPLTLRAAASLLARERN